jgi:hypothetical protein
MMEYNTITRGSIGRLLYNKQILAKFKFDELFEENLDIVNDFKIKARSAILPQIAKLVLSPVVVYESGISDLRAVESIGHKLYPFYVKISTRSITYAYEYTNSAIIKQFVNDLRTRHDEIGASYTSFFDTILGFISNSPSNRMHPILNMWLSQIENNADSINPILQAYNFDTINKFI